MSSLSGLIIIGRSLCHSGEEEAMVIDSPIVATTWQAQLGVSERQQQEHYDDIAADYEAHYSDEWSVEYRRRFIYEPMFEGLNL